jgi:YbgC/YbaW family acyl-CoA thioester hydrolase
MATEFRSSRRIEFADTDMAGIVHFANFFRFMEAAEQELLRSRGLSVAMDWEGQPIGFPRVGAACDYFKPARFEDVLTVVVRIERLGTKSITYTFDFLRHDELLARGRVSSVCCRVLGAHQFESIEIPAGYRARLAADG